MTTEAELRRAREGVASHRAEQRENAPASSMAGQCRAIHASAKGAVQQAQERREALAKQGLLTPEGIRDAMKEDVQKLRTELETLRAENVAPRKERIESAAASIAERPQPTETSRRLVDAYREQAPDRQGFLLANALAGKHPELASALAAEDPLVSGLTPSTVQRLHAASADDETRQRMQTIESDAREVADAERAIDDALATLNSFT